MVILGPKMTHLSNFRASKNFHRKKEYITFECLLNLTFMQNIRKKVMCKSCQESWDGRREGQRNGRKDGGREGFTELKSWKLPLELHFL